MAKRASATLISLILVMITMFGLVPLVLTVTALPLFVVWLGIPLLLGALALTRVWTNGARWLAGQLSGRPVARPYRAHPKGAGPIGMVRNVLTDPATWRDLLWILVSCTAGYVLVTLVLAFAAAVLFYLSYPLLIGVTPPGIFNEALGGLVVLNSWYEGFLMWPLAGLAAMIWWAVTPGLMAGWAAMARALLGPSKTSELAGQVTALASSRAETRDSAAAELRRIERDLHDGVQVKLASLGMSLGLIEQLMATDPDRARQLLAEASTATSATMADLRAVVRGIHPPVLADRGLTGAVESLSLELAVPCSVAVTGFTSADNEPVRLDPPLESCLYFGIAEGLANVVKHSGATRATVTLVRHRDRVVATVADNGRGGASQAAGTGLAGVARRFRAFDGILQVDSPVGGPTTITMEVPLTPIPAAEDPAITQGETECAPSSPKITRSSGKG